MKKLLNRKIWCMDNTRDLMGETGANIKALRFAKGLQQKDVTGMTVFLLPNMVG